MLVNGQYLEVMGLNSEKSSESGENMQTMETQSSSFEYASLDFAFFLIFLDSFLIANKQPWSQAADNLCIDYFLY